MENGVARSVKRQSRKGHYSMTQPDLRLMYLAANKTVVTSEILEDLLLRTFAASFCETEDEITARIIISQLSECLCMLADYEYEKLCDAQEEPTAQTTPNVQPLAGNDAEDYYYRAVVELYVQNGYDKLYAEEAASWPEVLNVKTEYLPETLKKLAAIEVGHDLIVCDYLRATFDKKTNGCVK